MIIKWLQKPRFYSTNTYYVNKSIFQWVKWNDKYYLSILGMINGPLPKLFKVILVVWMGKLRFMKRES